MTKVAILDDYAHIALEVADWSAVKEKAEVTVFDRHLSEDEAVEVLQPFNVVCTLRERMAFPRTLIERLPNLKLITIAGMSLPNLDMAAASECGILLAHPNFTNPGFAAAGNGVPELAWSLMIATVRNMAEEHRRVREGGWQSTVGVTLSGKTLGFLGLGRLGKRMNEYAKVFGMDVIAWSQNLTAEAAAAVGARRVEKETLFREADVISIGLVLSERTRGLVAGPELALMNPSAYLINISRGPIVDEAALIAALTTGQIAGAGLDVYAVEPLPADHPLRSLPNVTLSPHLGYVTRELLGAVYSDTVEAVAAWLAGRPVRILNHELLERRGLTDWIESLAMSSRLVDDHRFCRTVHCCSAELPFPLPRRHKNGSRKLTLGSAYVHPGKSTKTACPVADRPVAASMTRSRSSLTLRQQRCG